jgi:hypothetical protein
MESGGLSRKHYFLLFAVVFIFMASVAVFILCLADDQRYGSSGAALAVGWSGLAVAIFVPLVAIFVPIFARTSPPANYPRIEHLRIAGKYSPTDAAKMGVSPLRLR